MDNIKFNSFENICRTCMYTSDLKQIDDNNIIDVLQFLSGNKYSKNDELPQKLCQKCLETINDIQLFAFKCQQTHLKLKNCLNEFKNNLQENINTVEFIEIKQEIKEETDPNNLESTTDPLEKFVQIPEEIIKNQYKCEDCNKTFKYKKNTKLHTCHFKCKICMTSFQNSNDLISHKNIHNNEHPYQCEVCNKSFSVKNSLIKHKTIHNDVRRFECDVCMKRFQQTNDLTRHKRIHSGERPYHCEVCNKRFTLKSLLHRHKATHTDERQFECDICKKSFRQSAHLIGHKRIHSGERPYSCDICDNTFTQKSHLVTHRATHDSERQVQCDICQKNFIDLRKHKLKVHQVV